MSGLDIVREGDTVHVSGRWDASHVEKARTAFAALDGPVRLDCSRLEYISSAGISVLLATHKRLRDAGHPFTLVHVSQRIRNVFGYAGLDRILDLE
jgi:anti-sigma B factor antagonist